MMKKLLAPLLFGSLLCADTIDTLLEKLQHQNLQLQESREHIFIADEQAALAGTWDNPKLGIGANDLLLDNISTRDKEPMQTHFVTLSQKIPLGGKIHLRQEIAALQKKAAQLRYAAQVKKLRSKLLRYAFKAAIVERKIATIKRYRQNVRKLKHLYQKRFSIGRGSQQRVKESEISLKRLLIKQEKLTTQRADLLDQIAQLVYEDITSIETGLETNQTVFTDIKNHPQLRLAQIELKQAKERHALARAKKIPDITLGVGYYQRVNRSDYLALNANIPLPIRNKESKGIKIARLQIRQRQQRLDALRFKLILQEKALRRRLADAKKSYTRIQEEIIPMQRYIHKLLKQEIFTQNSSTTTLIQNLNETIRLELDAYDELERYFETYAELDYFSGAVR
jgi:cobalt-zinc-cadmium efflux system outer membrane protein